MGTSHMLVHIGHVTDDLEGKLGKECIGNKISRFE